MRRLRAAVLPSLLLLALPLLPTAGAGAAERVVTFSVRQEGVVGDLAHVAWVATTTLNDPRGWSLGGTVAYRQVATGGDLIVVLAAPSVVAAAAPVCDASYSCRVGNRVYLNDVRWRTAVPHWPHGLLQYQRYVLMHEVGHWLGMGHTFCSGAGRAATVMQQQSISLQGCAANVWPLIAERAAAGRYLRVSVAWTDIERAYIRLGQERGVLGHPQSWEQPTGVGSSQAQRFERGDVVWSPATGAREVHGDIAQRYRVTGGPRGPLGLPTTDELATWDGVGRFNFFDGSGGGSVHWTPRTGAQEVYGAIFARWRALHYETGPLGYPVTGERLSPGGVGRYNDFAGSGGATVAWSPRTGAHEVYGDIRRRWAALGREGGVLGLPVTGERATADRRGRYNDFAGSGGATVAWSPRTGAHEVYGDIRRAWVGQGRETGALGLPVTGERDVPGGRQSDFEGGSIRWDRATGATEVRLS